MKKVLIYKSQLLPYSETFIKEQIVALRDWHGVLIGEEILPNGLDLEGLDVRLIASPRKNALQRLASRVTRFLDIPFPGVVGCLVRENAQLLHIHFGVEAVRSWPIARALGLPVLITLHGYDINIYREWWEAGNAGRLMRDYPRRLLQIAESERVIFIAVSEAIRRRAIEYGIPAEKIIVHYVGVDTKKFAPAGLPIKQRSRRVLFVGRLVENKGCDYLIRAFAKVQRIVPDAELAVVGDGPLRAEYERLALELRCRLSFLGVLPPADVKKQMDQARVLCQPSVTIQNGASEGLPTVILEAQSCGLPVITSARGGATEGIQDSQTGFAHQERDVDQLVKSIERILNDDDLACDFSISARKRAVRCFDIERCTKLLEATYEKHYSAPSFNKRH